MNNPIGGISERKLIYDFAIAHTSPLDTQAQAEEIVNKINVFAEACEDSLYSFAHIALDDYNLSKKTIMWCLEPENVKNYLLLRLNDKDESYDVADLCLTVHRTYWFMLGLLDYTEEALELAESILRGEESE